MTGRHLSWLQGPEDNPDPSDGEQSTSAAAAETREDLTWGQLYWQPRRPADVDEGAA